MTTQDATSNSPGNTPEAVALVAVSDSDTSAAEPEGAYVQANTMGEYAKTWLAKIKGGDSGVIPLLVGILLFAIIFQALNGNFLSAGNIVNLLSQGSVYVMLSLGEIFALLLGEIDLSIGFVGGVGGIVTAQLASAQHGWPWWLAIIAGLAVTALIGVLQGTIITRIGLPSFVVTLAGFLGWQGVMLMILGNGGTLPISNNILNDIANASLSNTAGWAIVIVLIVTFSGLTLGRQFRRSRAGLHTPPLALVIMKVAAAAIFGVALVIISNTDRGVLVPISGLPWVVLIVAAFVGASTFLLGRTKFGRYVYAIGGNPEAARRGGVNLGWVRTGAFALASFTAGVAGIIYASRLRSVSTNLDGGTLVLYAVAASVIGGTSLFGGRGKPIHAILGGLVIAGIDNGMGLLGISAAARLVVTGLVLLAAVLIDALARRGNTAH